MSDSTKRLLARMHRSHDAPIPATAVADLPSERTFGWAEAPHSCCGGFSAVATEARSA
jgi:hypothetical protein